jgi:hypothetical protein
MSLLDSNERAAGLGKAGREFVRANFSSERFATNMVHLYDQAIQGRRLRQMPAEPARNSAANLRALKRVVDSEGEQSKQAARVVHKPRLFERTG